MEVKNLLLLNLGSPDSPSVPDVARYLRQFLTDGQVIDIPAFVRYPLVYGVIVPRRAANSAEAYAKIWTPEGSPLVTYTREFTRKVALELGAGWNVQWAMRYGSPSTESVLPRTGEGPLWVVPLYPQYALSSTQTAIDEVNRVLAKSKSRRQVNFLNDFFADPLFLEAQASRIQQDVDRFQPDTLLLSFHGLPEHHLTKLPPRLNYRDQCVTTVAELKKRLRFPENKISFSFQSRLGSRPWIKPYTDVVIEELARDGAKRILVSCPSFVADCLETLEEIQMRLREQFLEAGGEDLRLIPALNTDALWVQNFSKMARAWVQP